MGCLKAICSFVERDIEWSFGKFGWIVGKWVGLLEELSHLLKK